MVPDLALAVAERFALRGKNVLVLLTDMTNFADAMKEIAITPRKRCLQPRLSRRPLHPAGRPVTKAVDFADAGSITILAATTMPGDDVTHLVPDNTGYITEGQFYLKNGRIEPFWVAVPAQAAGQREDAAGPPADHGRDDQVVRVPTRKRWKSGPWAS